MNKSARNISSNGSTLSGKTKLMMAVILVVAAGTGALALFMQPSHATEPATASAGSQRQEELKEKWLERSTATTNADFSVVQDRITEHQFLAERAAITAAAQKHEELKDAWMQRGAVATTPSFSLTQDRIAEHQFLAERAAIAAAAQTHEALKDAWLERRGVSGK